MRIHMLLTSQLLPQQAPLANRCHNTSIINLRDAFAIDGNQEIVGWQICSNVRSRIVFQQYEARALPFQEIAL
jgi:hypothetical protein